MERNWTGRKYHVQDNAYVAHQDVKMFCSTNRSPELTFFGPHPKPHVARGLSKNYHLRFDPKLGMGVCSIRRIPCAFFACTSILDKSWIYGIPTDEQDRYKPVIKCNYWPVLGFFNNLDIIQLSQKSTPSETFDEIHQVVIDGISDNMAFLVESGKYGAINTTYTKTNGFYVIMFTSESYTLQDNTTIDGKIITAEELVVKAQYLCSMQVDTSWYWNQQPKQHVTTVSTRTILHPQLEVNALEDFHAIPKIVCNRTQKNAIPRQPIYLTGSNCNYILKEFGRQDKIEFERDVEVYSYDEEN